MMKKTYVPMTVECEVFEMNQAVAGGCEMHYSVMPDGAGKIRCDSCFVDNAWAVVEYYPVGDSRADGKWTNGEPYIAISYHDTNNNSCGYQSGGSVVHSYTGMMITGTMNTKGQYQNGVVNTFGTAPAMVTPYVPSSGSGGASAASNDIIFIGQNS